MHSLFPCCDWSSSINFRRRDCSTGSGGGGNKVLLPVIYNNTVNIWKSSIWIKNITCEIEA